MTKEEMKISYDDTVYKNATSNFTVPGLFNNFQTAATLLRIARNELPWKSILGDQGETIVSNFYNLLQKVEESRKTLDVSSVMTKKFIIEIEGTSFLTFIILLSYNIHMTKLMLRLFIHIGFYL